MVGRCGSRRWKRGSVVRVCATGAANAGNIVLENRVHAGLASAVLLQCSLNSGSPSDEVSPPACPPTYACLLPACLYAGRYFYGCARAAGPPPQGQCGFFQASAMQISLCHAEACIPCLPAYLPA